MCALMEKRMRWILLGLIGVVGGVYFGVTSGSSSLLVRCFVGVGMGVLVSWLVGGFVK